MWKYPIIYDVIVIGAGHAGCEAALASARSGALTLVLTMNLDTIGKMSCNPAIGGIAKGHMVREIDALGGEMAKAIDRTGIQFRMLNRSKGPAVWAPRAQADKAAYQLEMKHRLEKTANLHVKQGTSEEILCENGKAVGVTTLEGIEYRGGVIILSAGTFMRGLLHIGQTQYAGGRAGDKPSVGLSANLEKLGHKLGRFKTGTPPRVNSRTIDYSRCEEQLGEEDVTFSFDEVEGRKQLPQLSCYITYTSKQTKAIVEQNIHRSPMYSGQIKGIGPRYCPSIEDKVMRFADKERHQIFLEPEGINTEEVYVNGVSSSLPFDVQLELIHSIPGLEQAEIMRPAYAIEYDYITTGQIHYSLESKVVENLFLAGQINGTSGYEEAAAQGLIAGINAVAKLLNKEPLILQRSEAYIGVLIDDLVNKELDEPYRMFTSRAEHRLLLRQDNADLRLRKFGYKYGLIDEPTYQKLLKKEALIASESERLQRIFKQVDGRGVTLAQLLARPDTTYTSLLTEYPDSFKDFEPEINMQIELEAKYAGYIKRQKTEVEKLENVEKIKIPMAFDYAKVVGLRKEAQEKLLKHTPCSLGAASRLSGVSPADISILMVYLTHVKWERDQRTPLLD